MTTLKDVRTNLKEEALRFAIKHSSKSKYLKTNEKKEYLHCLSKILTSSKIQQKIGLTTFSRCSLCTVKVK